MNFIFPKNYNFKSKILGIIDYSTAVLNLIIGFILFNIINFIFEDITIKIYLFISLYFPLLLFSILGINKENFITVFIYMYDFFKNQRVYLYKKR